VQPWNSRPPQKSIVAQSFLRQFPTAYSGTTIAPYGIVSAGLSRAELIQFPVQHDFRWGGSETIFPFSPGLIGIGAGVIAGSISLVGFGVDSLVEVTSGATLLWRMSADANVEQRGQNERLSLRIVGGCFLALAAYVTYEAVLVLIWRSAPQHSIPGIVLACVSLIVMPILSRAKKRVGNALGSAAMHADARQTDFCVYLSAILLVGLLLNAILGWWWADPIAALIMVPVIAKEGIDGITVKACC
jgi:divalent metal cation (Fe/Co/Zn/Cd) transporter